MGMSDVIIGEIICPKCNELMLVSDQIKWTKDPTYHKYMIGDKIDAPDGVYTYATPVRDTMYSYCPNCCSRVHFKAKVEKGSLYLSGTTCDWTKRSESLVKLPLNIRQAIVQAIMPR